MQTQAHKCRDCRFFRDFRGPGPHPKDNHPIVGDYNGGHCHRYPPVLVLAHTSQAIEGYDFPIAVADDWCGEFVLK